MPACFYHKRLTTSFGWCRSNTTSGTVDEIGKFFNLDESNAIIVQDRSQLYLSGFENSGWDAVELSKTGLEYVSGDKATKSAKDASISTKATLSVSAKRASMLTRTVSSTEVSRSCIKSDTNIMIKAIGVIL